MNREDRIKQLEALMKRKKISKAWRDNMIDYYNLGYNDAILGADE